MLSRAFLACLVESCLRNQCHVDLTWSRLECWRCRSAYNVSAEWLFHKKDLNTKRVSGMNIAVVLGNLKGISRKLSVR